ncbi:hypothetical protein GCM10009416_18820 [Craurococcus roseus]|uniref:Uncharacterized protein n=1 Tax=Craurococcus roseus TaxID=77585 RepID=A0ABP3Q7P5_9PROT
MPVGASETAGWRKAGGRPQVRGCALVCSVKLRYDPLRHRGEAVLTPAGTPLAAAAAHVLLAVASACSPDPRYCSPQPDRFERNRSTARENDREVHPIGGVVLTAVAAATALAGYRCY